MQINFARVLAVESGYYARVQVFPVRRVSRKRGAKRKPTGEMQAHVNLVNSQRRECDLLHLNFTPDDMEVGLDYRPNLMPRTERDCYRIMVNFLRRLKRAWSAAVGKPVSEFRYLYVTERTESGRWHHHCAFSGGLSAERILEIWDFGRVHAEPLQFSETGLRGLSRYILKNRYSYRRWYASRNLRKPAPRTSDRKLTMKELRYINEHPEDAGYIEERFPGWAVAPFGVTVSAIRGEETEETGKTGKTDMGEGHEAPLMPFIELFLYRPDCPYFRVLPDGRVRNLHGLDWEAVVPLDVRVI